MTINTQRMVVGNDWSGSFVLKGGYPSLPITLTDWTISGKAWLSQLPSKYKILSITETTEGDPPTTIPPRLIIQNHVVTESDLRSDRSLIVGSTVQMLIVKLEEADTEYFGEGVIEFEIKRTAPQPTRPILRFRVANYES